MCTAALGMTMVIVAGGIDLSVGLIVALTTVVVALYCEPTMGRWRPRSAGVRLRGVRADQRASITRCRVVPSSSPSG